MANEFLRLSCPYCGGTLAQDGELYKCADCGNRFEKKKTETDSEKIRSILDEMKAEQVANIRRRLWEETHKEYISSEEIRDAAQKILDILPEDRFASFYKAAVADGYEELNRFLDGYDATQTDDLPLILDFSIKVMEQLNISSVKALAERGLTGDAKIDYYSKIEAEAEKIESGIYNTDVPRTVFLAYSSKDMKKVNEVAAYLESQNFTCFVALRNLRHGKGAKENYQAEIMNAIANCKCVVFLSSENSRAMTCDAMRIEIPYLRKTYPDKPRIEFLLEEYGKNTLPAAKTMLKEYFKNLEYCTTFEDLASRVWDAESSENIDSAALSKQQEEMMKKIQALEEKAANQTVSSSSGNDIAPMIQRAEAMLAEGDFAGASSVGDRILDRDYECAMGYVIKLMAELKVKKQDKLSSLSESFDRKANYKKALQYADEKFKEQLRSYSETINKRMENKRMEEEYQNAVAVMRSAKAEGDFKEAIELFTKIIKYSDAKEKIAECKTASKEITYQRAKSMLNNAQNEQQCTGAKIIFLSISDFSDSEEQIKACEKKIASIKEQEQARAEAERRAEEQRRAKEAKEEARKKKIKRAKIILYFGLSLVLLAIIIYLFSPNRIFYAFDSDRQGYSVTLIANCKGDVVIPETHNGKPVTSIGNPAFYDCSKLTSITIPDSVTSIGDTAFSGCSSLNAVYITDLAKWCEISFTGYFSNPLYYAHNLYINGTLATSITIPNSVTSIGSCAFCDCSSLTSITIPDSVTSIGYDAFNGCSSLTSIAFAENSKCTSIGSYAFYNCSSLTSITIPDSVTSIGEHAFYKCSSLTSITIPDSVISIGERAFAWCGSLTSITFQGTKAQWNAISKGYAWNTDTGAYTIHCTDGNISKS